MGKLELAELLQSVTPEAPCGDDLEYDPAFQDLERAAAPQPEPMVGDSAAEEPDWRAVESKAVALLARTKDLRIGIHLLHALLRNQGLPGLRDGLALLQEIVERYWDSVHPRLDPDDGNDATLRINVLMALADPGTTGRYLREAPLVQLAHFGDLKWRDVELASGKSPPTVDSDARQLDSTTIDAAFAEGGIKQVYASAAIVLEAIHTAQAIERACGRHVEVEEAGGIKLENLVSLLDKVHKFLEARLPEEELRGNDDGSGPIPAVDPDLSPEPHPTTPSALPATASVNNRQEVIRVLDMVCDYYSHHEPSSPVPMLLLRAKRLVSKDFMEIITELVPTGLAEAEVIRGKDPDDASN